MPSALFCQKETQNSLYGEEQLTETQVQVIAANELDPIGVSAISCWEVAKLVERGRLELPYPLEEWFELALGYPGVSLLELTPEIAIASTRLPGQFHRDPADQIIVSKQHAATLLFCTQTDLAPHLAILPPVRLAATFSSIFARSFS